MRVLVTGGAGFIGGHFARAAIASGHWPVVLDNLSTGHEWAMPDCPFYKADTGDIGAVVNILRSERIDAVAHFAALSIVADSVREPALYFQNNYTKTLCLLDAMAASGVGLIVFSSSAAVYGLPARVPIQERVEKRPINPYGWSKHFVEESLRAYEASHGIRHISLRYFNAAGAEYGMGELHEPETHLIPSAILAAMGRRDSLTLHGDDHETPDGTCVRDYVHVADLADAHMLALGYLSAGGRSAALNIGSSRGHSVREVLMAVERVTGLRVPVRHAGRRPGDPPVLVAECALAEQTLGWRPVRSSLDRMIDDEWKWLCRRP